MIMWLQKPIWKIYDFSSIGEEDVAFVKGTTFAGINQINDLYYIMCSNGRLYT